MTFEMNRFRALLKRERVNRKCSRERLAEKSGVNKTTIQNVEGGPDIPGIDTVAKIIEGMGHTMSEFFRDLERGTAKNSLQDHLDFLENARRVPSHDARSQEHAAVSLDDLRVLIQAVSTAALTAIANAENRATPSGPSGEQSERPPDRARLDRGIPEPQRRLKGPSLSTRKET